MMLAFNLALRFALELAMIVGLAVAGAKIESSTFVRLLVAIGAPLAAVFIWGRWIAPRAATRLPDPERFGVEAVLFLVTGVLLAATTSVVLGVLLVVLGVGNALIVRRLGGEEAVGAS